MKRRLPIGIAALALASLWFLDNNVLWPILGTLILATDEIFYRLRSKPEPVTYWTEDMVEEDDPAKRQILCDVMNTGNFMCGTRDESGNLFYERGVSGNREVVPMNEADRAFLRNAQGLTCGSVVLPSGLTLAKESGKVWKVVEDRFVLVDQNEQDIS